MDLQTILSLWGYATAFFAFCFYVGQLKKSLDTAIDCCHNLVNELKETNSKIHSLAIDVAYMKGKENGQEK